MFNFNSVRENDKRQPTVRTAVASGSINMSTSAIKVLAENATQNAGILNVARVAAVQGIKQVGLIVPLYQPAVLQHVRVDFDVDVELAYVKATVTVTSEGGKSITTEAITGVNVALMSIYDMMKEVDQSMMMTRIHLESESGGERGPFVFDDAYENIEF